MPNPYYWNGQQWVNLDALPRGQQPPAAPYPGYGVSLPPPVTYGNEPTTAPYAPPGQETVGYPTPAGPQVILNQYQSPADSGSPSMPAGYYPYSMPQWSPDTSWFPQNYQAPPGDPFAAMPWMQPADSPFQQSPLGPQIRSFTGPLVASGPGGWLPPPDQITQDFPPATAATSPDTQVILNQAQATATPDPTATPTATPDPTATPTATPGVTIDPSGAGLADPNLGPTPGATPFDPYAGPSDVLGPGGSPNYYPTGDGRYWTYDQNWQYTGTTGTPDVPPAPGVGPGNQTPPSDVPPGGGIPTAPGVTPDVASAIPIDPGAPTGNLIPDLGADIKDIGRTLGGIPVAAANAIRNAAPQGPGGWGQPSGPSGTAGPGPLPNLNPSGITWQDVYASGVDPRVDASGNPISVQSVPAPSGGPQIFGQGSFGTLPASLAYESINWNAPGMQGWLDPFVKFNQAQGTTFAKQIQSSFPGYANWPKPVQVGGDAQGGGKFFHAPSPGPRTVAK